MVTKHSKSEIIPLGWDGRAIGGGCLLGGLDRDQCGVFRRTWETLRVFCEFQCAWEWFQSSSMLTKHSHGEISPLHWDRDKGKKSFGGRLGHGGGKTKFLWKHSHSLHTFSKAGRQWRHRHKFLANFWHYTDNSDLLQSSLCSGLT